MYRSLLGLLVVFLAATAATAAAAAAAAPNVDAPPALTLKDALVLARVRSPRIAAARAQRDGAGQGADVASRAADPRLDLLSENWRGGDFDARTDLELTAVFVQSLEPYGTRGGRRDVAAGELAEAEALLSAAEREVQLDTVRAYLGTIRGRELAHALAGQAERLSAIVSRLRRQVEEGFAAEAELMKFTSEKARVDIELARSQVDADRDAALLAALIGRPLPPGGLARPAPLAPPAGDPVELAQAMASRLPALRAAEARLARARAASALERARSRGDLDLTAGYKRTEGLNTGVLGLGFTLPLFDRNAWAVARAKAEEQAAEFTLQAEREIAEAELVAFLDRARRLAELAASAQETLLAPAEIARAAALSAFTEGRVGALDLVDAERVYTEARRGTLELESEAYFAAFDARLLAEQEIPR